ncbi:MAG: M28 family metallopeptidase [Fimbriimonadales bacterium]
MIVAGIAFFAMQPPSISQLVSQVSPERLRATVEKLASYNTRNTLSPTLNEAAEWLAGEYRKIPGIQAEVMSYTLPKGRRVPEDKTVVQVVATLPGETDHRILIGGHMDSLNLQVDPVTGRAPGANDDSSGVAVALELARILAPYKWRQTLVFVGFSGEEQGLNGSRALAKRAKEEGWKLDAVLNNDTVGSSSNKAGQKDTGHVRVFSDENDRELARFIEHTVRANVKGFGIKLVLRKDRFGRGGDHTPFSEEGFPAVRFIEVHEEYTRQHTPDDLPEHMDWKYLANVAKADLASMATLAQADEPPTSVHVKLDQSHDTTLTWKGKPGVKYVVYWRDTASAAWQGAIPVGAVETFTIKKINKDDHYFAVGAENGIPVPAK